MTEREIDELAQQYHAALEPCDEGWPDEPWEDLTSLQQAVRRMQVVAAMEVLGYDNLRKKAELCGEMADALREMDWQARIHASRIPNNECDCRSCTALRKHDALVVAEAVELSKEEAAS